MALRSCCYSPGPLRGAIRIDVLLAIRVGDVGLATGAEFVARFERMAESEDPRPGEEPSKELLFVIWARLVESSEFN